MNLNEEIFYLTSVHNHYKTNNIETVRLELTLQELEELISWLKKVEDTSTRGGSYFTPDELRKFSGGAY